MRTSPKNRPTPAGALQPAHAATGVVVTDAQIGYRLDEELPLEWIGDGLRDVGIQPGTTMTEQQKPWAYALMDGKHPNGAQLVRPKLAIDPRGKLAARPLLESLDAAMELQGTSLTELLGDRSLAASYARLRSGVERLGDAYRAPVATLRVLAEEAGLDLSAMYEPAEYRRAVKHANAKVVIGNRGYDITLDLSKSVSVLYAMADPRTAHQLETVYLQTVRETIGVMQDWVAYGMRGHHGDGKRAIRMNSTGLLGWMMVHRAARPVEGAPADPHLHVHVVLANLVHGLDGKWSTVAAGGRDLHRHAHAADAYLKARMRDITRRRWGIEWRRDLVTGAWEIAAIPDAVRDLFSKRSVQIDETLGRLGLTGLLSSKQTKLAAAISREAKQPPPPPGQQRVSWQSQARQAGFDPVGMTAAAMPGPQPATALGNPTPEQIAAYIFREERSSDEIAARGALPFHHVGLLQNRKTVTRADVLAAVMDALPDGLPSLADAENLTNQVLAVAGYAVKLDRTAPAHLSNNERYTSENIVRAEDTVLKAAHAGLNRNVGVLRTDLAQMAVAQFATAARLRLSDEQHAVLRRLMHTGHQVDAVIGVAGSGKTTLMAALRAAYHAAGYRVAGASNSAVAAANLQAESGIKSATIASWIARAEMRNQHGQPIGLRGMDVLVVDEAATVDDRQMARLLRQAIPHGIKVIGIGDPMQLRAPGVGGTFAEVHRIVDGPSMNDNRRQRDHIERRALEAWRRGSLHQALTDWAHGGRVHVATDSTDAQLKLLARWEQARHEWPDVHDRIANLLILAGTNDDTDQINAAVQAIRIAAGDLNADVGHTYQQHGGGQLRLIPGDEVMIRLNERHRGSDIPDLLNGYRGVVAAIGPDKKVTIAWRSLTDDGPTVQQTTVDAGYIAKGGLSLGYALTVAKAQGLTSTVAVTYGIGLDPHTLYAAMTRARRENHLVLPGDMLESESLRAKLGPPRSPAEELRRAVNAYALWLTQASVDDTLVLDELEGRKAMTRMVADETLLDDEHNPDKQDAPEADDGHDEELSVAQLDALDDLRRGRERAADNHRTSIRPWRQRRHGRLTNAQLSRVLIETERDLAVENVRAEAIAERYAERIRPAADGQGQAAIALRERRQHLERAAEASARARQSMNDARIAAAHAGQLRADLQRPAPVRFVLGIDIHRTQRSINDSQTRAAAAQRAAEEARTEAGQHAERAGVTPDAVMRTLDRLNSHWEEAHQAAVDDDIAAQGEPPAPRREAAAHRRRLRSLRIEQERRMHMHPEDLRREDLERDQEQRERQRERERVQRDAQRHERERQRPIGEATPDIVS